MKQYTVLYMDSKHLDKTMKIFIMLPKSYSKSSKKYPVLYMHDGQNLFDEDLSYKGETWGVAEAYIEDPELPEVIIVGIETAGDFRTDVLVPFSFNWKDVGYEEFGDQVVGGKTDDYLSFIKNELKVYIDKTYRTYKSPGNTAIMGSSFGGVCSTYASLVAQDTFSRFGCVSNAYGVIQKQLEELIQKTEKSGIKKIYFDTGTKETSRAISQQKYIDSNQSVYELYKKELGESITQFKIVKDALHTEEAWRERFPKIIQFLFND